MVSQIRGFQWGGGFYGYRLKFRLFYGYRLIFSVTVNKTLKINSFCFKELNINKPVFFLTLKQNKGLRIISRWKKLFFWKILTFNRSYTSYSIPLLILFYAYRNVNSQCKTNLCEKAKADTRTLNSMPGREFFYNRNGRFHTRDGSFVWDGLSVW